MSDRPSRTAPRGGAVPHTVWGVSRLRIANAARVTPEPAASALWQRLTGTSLAAIDPTEQARACVELARREHLRSSAARAYRERLAPRTEPTLLLPGVAPSFYDDAEGRESGDAYREALRFVTAHPDDLPARVRLAGMQALTGDPGAALVTLRGAPRDDVSVRLTRAVASWLVGDDATARPEIEQLARTQGDARAAFNLGQIEHFASQQNQALTARRRGAYVRVAAYRVFLCGLATLGELPRGTRELAVERAYATLALIEQPGNSQAPCPAATLLPLAELPPDAARHCAHLLEDRTITCAHARVALDLAFIDRPTLRPPEARPLRALSPAVTAVTPPRPLFAWHGLADTWERCADPRCEQVVERQPATSPFHPTRPLPVGRWYWRVRGARASSPVRTVWVDPRAHAARAVPDVNGDGWPDVPLGALGAYARFDAGGVPVLTPFPVGDGRHAAAQFVGDLDGDGFGDFLQTGTLGAVARLGSREALVAPAYVPGDELWHSVAPFLDLDGDGLTELYLPNHHRVRYSDGRVEWFPADGSSELALTGDVDVDGFDDFLSGSYNFDTATGRRAWHRVTARGVDPRPYRVADRAPFGGRIHPVGDLDGDGRDDLIAPRHVPDGGALRMVFDVWTALDRHPRPAFEARGSDAMVWSAGDVDGDGHGDVIVQLESGLSLRFGSTTGLSPRVRRIAVDATFRNLVVVQPGVEAAPTPCWIFLDRPTRAIRVTASEDQTMLLDAP